MLYIKKNAPSLATQAKLSQTKRDSHWNTVPENDINARRVIFDNMDKSPIQQDLIPEQHHLCGYCMRPIEVTFEGIRIDHFIPLSEDKEKTLDYNNYLGVCYGGSQRELQTNPQGYQSRKIKRILCCDAQKKDQRLLAINPWNEAIMDHIAYYTNGYIYFKGRGDYSETFCNNAQNDIDNILQLNGIFKKDKDNIEWISDTTTKIVEGRRNAFTAANKILADLQPLTSHKIDREIQSLLDAPKRQPFVGVIVYKLKQVRDRLQNQGR